LSRVVEYLFLDVVYADDEISLLAGDSAFRPIDQGDEGDWDTVGEPAGASRSPAPTVEELVAQLTRQPPIAEGELNRAWLLLKSQRLPRPKGRRLPKLD
jgi:hypothetical protein